MHSFLMIILAIFLVLLNGLFVAAEFAIVKLRHTQVLSMEKSYGIRGKLLAYVHKNLDTFLSACQVGITFASLGLGWIGEPAFAGLIEPWLHKIQVFSVPIIQATAFFIAFFIISFLHVVVGELVPKSLAIRSTKSTSLLTIVPLYLFNKLAYPIIWLLNVAANFVIKLLKLDVVHCADNYSTEELKLIIKADPFHKEGNSNNTEIVLHSLELLELMVTDIMLSADELVMLNIEAPLAENLHLITKYRFSRYPIYKDEMHNVLGLVHVKDLFAWLQTQQPLNNLQQVMRPILIVERNTPATELLQQFRKGSAHFAIIKNDAGRLIGYVTLDNILGALIGHIQDEFHQTKEVCRYLQDGSLLIKGNAPLYALEREFEIDLDQYQADTISGLILNYLERLPQPGELIPFENFTIKICKMAGPKISLVKIYKNK